MAALLDARWRLSMADEERADGLRRHMATDCGQHKFRLLMMAAMIGKHVHKQSGVQTQDRRSDPNHPSLTHLERGQKRNSFNFKK